MSKLIHNQQENLPRSDQYDGSWVTLILINYLSLLFIDKKLESFEFESIILSLNNFYKSLQYYL